TLQFDPSKVLLFDAKTGERLGVAGQAQTEARYGERSRNSKAGKRSVQE
ncbi:hypothetical protein HT737_08220, partial [Pseudomonas sp. MD195_PC81_125]|nr:hypothetical protein [Pseudomonas sp. MD195_PC81_125]